MRYYFLLALFAVALARADSAAQLDPSLQEMAAAHLAKHATPGLVIGIVNGDAIRVQGFGALGKARPGRPDARTVYEIGSLSKTFTALLLANAEARKELALDDPLALYLPDHAIPRVGPRAITLLDLATHSSGLPRLPDNLLPKDPANPYADYSLADLKRFLARHALVRAPGERYDYSNLGYGLLGAALSQRAGKDYATLVRERITDVLGMGDTAIALRPDMRARLAAGHDGRGQSVSGWDLPQFEGAGALRSTAHDLLLYVRAHLQAAKAASLPGLQAVQLARRPGPGPDTQLALGWHLRQAGGKSVLWHNGMTGGYASFMAMTADGQRGVVVLANASISMDELGMAALLPELRQASLAPGADQKLAPELLAQYAGRYQLAPGFVLDVTAAPEGLTAQATGQGPARVYPLKADEFVYRIVDARLQFLRGADGKVASLVLHQGGRAMPAARIADEAAAVRKYEAIALPVKALRQFVGRYQLAPAFLLAVTEDDGRLYIQATGQGRSEVFPYSPDAVFSKIADVRITFRRDAQGQVNALVLHQNSQDMPAARLE